MRNICRARTLIYTETGPSRPLGFASWAAVDKVNLPLKNTKHENSRELKKVGKAGVLACSEALQLGNVAWGWELLLHLLNKCSWQVSRSLNLYSVSCCYPNNKNQSRKTESHPPFAPSPPPGCGHGSGMGGREWLMPQGGNENWLRGEASKEIN